MCLFIGLFLLAFSLLQGSQGALGLAVLEVALALLFFAIAYNNYKKTGSIHCEKQKDEEDTPNK